MSDLGISALLSAVLVAFTVEFDNEFEHHLSAPGAAPVRLTSMVMWSNFMRFVGEGTSVAELTTQAGVSPAPVHPSLAGMQRWGYVVARPEPVGRAKPPRSEWIVRPTEGGRQARALWPTIFPIVEDRWAARYGTREMHRLRTALESIAGQLDASLPQYLPAVTRAMFLDLPSSVPPSSPPPSSATTPNAPHLPLLLSRLLIAFALEFEQDAALSLPIFANALRVLDERGVRVRDMPRLAGVSKPAVAMSLGFLEKNGYATFEPDPNAARTRRVRPTAKGLDAQTAHARRLTEVEARWQERFADDLTALRASCEPLAREPHLERSPLAQALETYRTGWRASVPEPAVLPRHPMVLPRGGWPDGS